MEVVAVELRGGESGKCYLSIPVRVLFVDAVWRVSGAVVN